MAIVRTVDFLPEIFQTPANKQFLAATLDQVVQNPEFRRIQGYIGNKIGAGVDASDIYVSERTKSRADYQLDPTVVSMVPDTNTNEDAITYPGIIDSIKLQGGTVDNADRLFTSDYYSWDPFVDFDKLVNYHQYYWLPEGPQTVVVSATSVPSTDKFYVTRTNTGYTFDQAAGTDPTLILVRGGTYDFVLDQSYKTQVNYNVNDNSVVPNGAFVINRQENPTLTLVRGTTYQFNITCTQTQTTFFIKTKPSTGLKDTYDDGVMRNGATKGLISFTVPLTAPNKLYYVSAEKHNMRGEFDVVDPLPGDGPEFWIQAQPGVSGTLPEASNISSRDVLGVVNNGINTGHLTFNVPLATDQDYYYERLTSIGSVDLLSDTVSYSDLQGVPVDDFILKYPDGIDQINNLNGRTIVFLNPEAGVDPWTKWYVEYKLVRETLIMELVSIQFVQQENKFEVLFGDKYSRTEWFRSVDDQYDQVPLLTAVLNTLYYQDSLNPNMFGSIKLINQDLTSTILVDKDIIGHTNYTAPNGVVFTNGLKIQFQGSVEPAFYQGQTYYVEGVGSAIKLLPIRNFVTPEKCFRNLTIPYSSLPYDIGGYDGYLHAPIDPEYIVSSRSSLDRSSWCRSNRWFHIDVILATNEYNKFTNKIVELDKIVQGRRPILEFRGGTKLFNFGTYGIEPVDVIDFDETDALLNVNGAVNYIVDGYSLVDGSIVIFAADANPEVRRTVYRVRKIELEPLNDGDYDIAPYAFTPYDAQTPVMPPIIYLEPIYYAEINDSTVCMNGQYPDDEFRLISGNYDVAPYDATPYDFPKESSPDDYHDGVRGVTFYYNGVRWIYAQQQLRVNQDILFDIFDQQGYSLSDKDKYDSSNFVGCPLLSYARGTGPDDPFLGIPLSYLNINNIGDIMFDNNLYTQEFKYVNGRTSITQAVSTGFVRQYSSRTEYSREIGWQNGITRSLDRQELQYIYDGMPTRLDVKISDETIVLPIQVFINGRYWAPNKYIISTVFDKTQINWLTYPLIGDTIEVVVLSEQISENGFYRIPMNLANNPLNDNSPAFSLGTIRNHYGTIAVTKPGFEGTINGANNSRDLGNLVPWGLQILQQSSPLTVSGYFMRNQEYDIFAALGYNNREYTQFKSQLLTTVVNNEFGYDNVADILDQCLDQINLGKTNNDSFYWSDMLPSGKKFQEVSYTVNALTNGVFNLNQVYDFTSANFQGLLIFLTVTDEVGNRVTTLLEKGIEYLVSPDLPLVDVLINLNIGDVITIREYPSTAGNFVPNTPSKMGLYPKYRPYMFLDTSYIKPTWVIQGHDGSITVAFNDIRDQVLLEFEKRIYNNIKTDGNPVPLVIEDVMPGFFRKTGYSLKEINDILSIDFLSWVGWNKLDYKPQDYIENNPFTYNYSESGTKLDALYKVDNVFEETIPGAWRGIYRYFYDTLDPSMTPWEMLGFSEMPCWWCDRYGPAPYTSGNLVLWTDLENGYVANPAGPYYLAKYARPGLTNVIPVNENGELIAPLFSVVGQFDSFAFKKSWSQGDGSPVEGAWWTSSAYPFAVMRLLALTRPAEFFSLFVDRDLYRYSNDLEQYLYNGRYRLGAQGVEVYGDGLSKASYINWIVDYNKQLGRNSTKDLSDHLKFLTVKLGYRLGGYSDKEYLQVYADHAIPNNTDQERTVPPESYSITLYKNQPSSEIVYSALTIEITDNRQFRIGGYDTIKPFFTAFLSQSSGTLKTITSGGETVQVPANYTDKTVNIPYGTVFVNTTMTVDFILSYGLYLESLGLSFESMENGYIMNWDQMAQEFLYFAGQGWAPGTVINLNPAGVQFSVYRPGVVVDTVESITPENMILDQNRVALPTRDLVIERLGNNFRVTSATGRTVSFARLRFVSYEDILLLDNVTVFGDLIFNPTTAARQQRMIIDGWITSEWDGTLNAPGFILNRKETIKEWVPNRKYTKGQIVIFKNNYWSALNIVKPKVKFEYSDWVISDYTKVQLGLLGNPANNSDQLANSYDVYKANLNLDNDLLSYGLIGFRPRQYMTDMNLDSVSQVNLYQQFLGIKGTTRAAEIFTYANFGKEAGTYEINEIWAILASTYGANANKSFVEFRLNEAQITANPSTIQVVKPFQQSSANQPILVSDIWRTSAVITTPDVFPVTTKNFSETALPSAGYVDLDDVDITVFDINQPTSLQVKMNTVGVGTTIWTAKINSYDWGVYRCQVIPGQIIKISDNLNGTAIVQFSSRHGLSVGQIIVIRYVSASVDGVYRVLTVPGIATITIAYSFINSQAPSLNTSGLGFYLQSARVKQPSDVSKLPFINDLSVNSKVWVDNNDEGLWEVLQKEQPFDYQQIVRPHSSTANQLFGTSIAQTFNDIIAFIGTPGSNNGKGTVEVYDLYINPNDTVNQPFKFLTDLTLDVPDTEAFGSAVSIGQNDAVAVGAPRSYSGLGYVLTLSNEDPQYGQRQVILPPNTDPGLIKPMNFGASLAISSNELWMYIGAPNDNKVFAYTKIEIPYEEATYIGDGKKTIFNYSDFVLIDEQYPGQIFCTVGNKNLEYPGDYRLSNGNVILTNPVPKYVELTITRRTNVTLNQYIYHNVSTHSTGGTGATFNVALADGDYSISVAFGGDFNYSIGDQLIIYGTQVGGTSPANDILITVLTVEQNQINTFAFSGTAVFNSKSYNLQNYLYTATDIDSVTITDNNSMLRPYIDYTFDPLTKVLTFTTTPADGVIVNIRAESYWKAIGEMTVPLVPTARFGHSISCTTTGRQIVVGSPYSVENTKAVGSSYVYNRSVYHYEVTDPTQRTYEIPEYNNGPVIVSLNGTILNSSVFSVNGQYVIDGNNIVLGTDVFLQLGDGIDIDTTQIKLIQTLTTGTDVTSQFGFASDFSRDNDEVYIGAPSDGTTLEQSGSVRRYVNQSRSYGVTTSTVANPQLTVGGTLLINGMIVTISGTTISSLADNINTSGIPNVNARVTSDLVFYGDGVTSVFDVGTIYSVCSSYTTKVLINGQTTLDYTYDNTKQTITFNVPPTKASEITVVSGRITIAVITYGSESIYNSNIDGKNELTVLPGIGNVFDELGFNTLLMTQTITSPRPTYSAHFGYSLSIDNSNRNLVIGSPDGDIYELMTFDKGTTYFDSHSTIFSDITFGSGVVFTYDFFPSVNSSVANPGMFVFGQQIYNNTLKNLDHYGTAVNYSNTSLLVSAPTKKNNKGIETGDVFSYKNTNDTPSWQIIHIQEPSVDSYGINSVFMYDRLVGSQQYYFDCINPLQGKVLGAAAQNIDYIGAVDPANYNVGTIHNIGDSWGSGQVGVIWWDTDTVRFLEPSQNDINYASRRWGQIFPGSRVDVYQWIASTVPPIGYTGPGTPLSTTTYTLESKINEQGYYNILYFYWVRGLNNIDKTAGKTLSTNAIAQYIADPRSSGIPYVAILGPSTVAIYNGTQYVSAADTILHVDYDQKFNTDCIHTEYQTILGNDRDSFLNETTYRKLLDSFSGADLNEHPVPDPMLSPGEKYGVQFRPRQSMFINRLEALRNYLGTVNTIILQYPIVESKFVPLLFSQELPPPAKDNNIVYWNERVPDTEILDYQDITKKPNGYKYLVDSNSNYNGLWTIVEVDHTATYPFKLVKVQSYYTPNYWSYVDWYELGYDPETEIVAKVPYYNSLITLPLQTVPIDASVLVINNKNNKWEIYKRTGIESWRRVGLQDGTIQFSNLLWDYIAGGFGFDGTVFDLTYFDNQPLIETRNIIRSINEEIFVDEMKIYRNELLILTFEYIYSELQAPYWLMKTSLVNVDHKIRALLPFEQYQPDNQTFVLDYINEVKPYHTVVKQFNLIYYGTDDSDNQVTDFDCPAYWDPYLTVPQFVSPMLLPFTHATTTINSNVGYTKSDAEIWAVEPWKDWYGNYTLSVQVVDVINVGQNYYTPPTVTAVGDCQIPAILEAVIDTEGHLTGIVVSYPGQGYLLTPEIVIDGDGTGARAVAHLANTTYDNPVTGELETSLFARSIKTTVKYDRYEYKSDIVDWQADVEYQVGTLVRYRDIVWQAMVYNIEQIFDPYQWVIITATTQTISNVVVTNGGAGYDPNYPPTIYLSSPNSKESDIVPAVLEANINSSGMIESIDVVIAGSGYTYPVIVTIGKPGDDAEAVVVLQTLLSGVNRTMGYYVPTVNQPGLELPLLIEGVEYPSVEVWGTPYIEGPYNNGNVEQALIGYGVSRYLGLDTVYRSEYTDLYLGTRYTDINVVGDNYISVDANYAPEELVLSATFDTVDIRVYTRPVRDDGIDNMSVGHGFPKGQVRKSYYTVDPTVDFSGLVLYITQITVTNQTTGIDLTPEIDYTVDWDNLIVTVINNAVEHDIIMVEVFGPGGGAEVFKEVYVNENTSEILIDVPYQEIYTVGWFVDGNLNGNISYADAPQNQTLVTLDVPLVDTQLATMVVIAPTQDGNTTIDYSWSTVQQQIIIADSTVTTYTLENSMAFTNPVNSIVTVNGSRLKTAAGAYYHVSEAAAEFSIPSRFGADPMVVTDEEILVYVDGIQQEQYIDYMVIRDSTDDIYIEFNDPLMVYEEILIAVNTDVETYIVDNELILNVPVNTGDIISVISWNDTRQQSMVTEVFVGPVLEQIPVTQGYSITRYSPALINDQPGSFDCTYEIDEYRNNLFLDRLIAEPSRLWVTVNGKHIFYGSGYTTREVVIDQGYASTLYDYAIFNDTPGSYAFSYPTTELVLPYLLGPDDVVIVTEYTDVLTPNASAFRIFQDMRGIQVTHEITRDTTTVLMRELLATDDVIYVKNAEALNVPNPEADIWGVLTINGERIMYREIDTASNTVRSLLRGTAGTGAADHIAGSYVYDMSKGTICPVEYQNYVVSDTTKVDLLGQTVFVAKDITLQTDDAIALRVYVAGIERHTGWELVDLAPATVQFDIAPPIGVDVTLAVLRANSWDNPRRV